MRKECFIKAAKSGKISGAAEELYMTSRLQATRYASLRRETCLSSVHQWSKGSTLTREDRTLFDVWQKSLKDIRVATDKARDLYNDRLRVALEDMGYCSEEIIDAFSVTRISTVISI